MKGINMPENLHGIGDDYITVGELADKFDKTYTQAYYLIKTGKIKAERLGWQYIIHISDIPKEWPVK